MSYYFCKRNAIRLIDGERIDHLGLNEKGYFTLTQLKECLGIKNKQLLEAMNKLGLRLMDDGKTFPTSDSGIVLRTVEHNGFYGYKPYYSQATIDRLSTHLNINPVSFVHNEGAADRTRRSPSPNTPAKKINTSLTEDGWEVPRFITLFDTETTGFSKRDAIVSFAYIHIDLLNREFIESDEIFADPSFTKAQVSRYESSDAYGITGIKIPGMAGCNVEKFIPQSVLSEKIVDALSYYNAAMAHNMSFDKRMINQTFERHNLPLIDEMDIDLYCSMNAARKLLGASGAGQSKLDTLCDRFDVDRSKRVLHGALLDIELMSEILYRFIDSGLLKIKDEAYDIYPKERYSNSGHSLMG